MAARTATLLEEALRLPVKARADLAGNLILSLDPGRDADAHQSWNREIDRRLAQFARQKASSVEWPEVKAGILRARSGRKRP